jgi:ubiquinone/menaquinone biosynthesis C-methylase UbiE
MLPLYWVLRVKNFFTKDMYLSKTQTIDFTKIPEITGPILDLGGGGEGVIGRIYGKQVTAVDLRKQELDETPEGPVKVVADAKSLPFADLSFRSVTAFYFFMYLKPADFSPVFRETYRVLGTNGVFYIWDTAIPMSTSRSRKIFAVPVAVQMTDKRLQTAYGVGWKERELTVEQLITVATGVGFKVQSTGYNGNAFYLELSKL